MEKINGRYHCVFINPTADVIAGIWKDDNAFFVYKWGIRTWAYNGFADVGDVKLDKGVKAIVQGRLVTWQE